MGRTLSYFKRILSGSIFFDFHLHQQVVSLLKCLINAIDFLTAITIPSTPAWLSIIVIGFQVFFSCEAWFFTLSHSFGPKKSITQPLDLLDAFQVLTPTVFFSAFIVTSWKGDSLNGLKNSRVDDEEWKSWNSICSLTFGNLCRM